MKTKTRTSQTQFIKSTNIPARLVRAVIRQSGGWDRFEEMAPDISNHGAAGGFNGWIYSVETEAFTKRHRSTIAQLAEEQAKEFGQGVLEMIASFNCFRGLDLEQGEIARCLYTGIGEDENSIRNALAWYALEETANAYCDYERETCHND
jgi:hypothetical protein